MKPQIGLIGPEEKNLPKGTLKDTYLMMAREIGKYLGMNKATLIVGGCSGVPEEACRAANNVGGMTVSTPGRNRGSSVAETTVEICTPIDVGDYIFAGVLSCDSIIVLPGAAGTLSELAIAFRYRKPLIFIEGYGESIFGLFNNLDLDYPVYTARDAEDAAKMAIDIAKENIK